MSAELGAAIYTRVSTGEQANSGTSMEAQELACLRKATDLKARVVAVFSDPGVSGGLFLTRPGIQDALRCITEGRAQVLIIYKLDRAGRDVDALRDIKRIVERAGGRLIFADGMNFENNATGRLMFTHLAGFAEYEKEVIRERTMSGSRRLAEKGVQPQRRSPYGYHIVNNADILRGLYPADSAGSYVVVEPQAVHVRRMFDLYAGGASLRDVVRYLIDNDVPTGSGRRVWWRTAVHCILTNPVYYGAASYGRVSRRAEEVRLPDGSAKHTVRKIRREADEVVRLSAPPLIDEETWRRAQGRMKSNSAGLGGNPDRRYLLTGLLHCPVCSRRMMGRGGLKPDMRQYICRRANPANEPGAPVCLLKCYGAERTEKTVIRALLQLAREPQWFDAAVAAYDQSEESETVREDPGAINAELRKIDRKEEATAGAQVQAIAASRSAAVYEKLLADIEA